MGEHRRVGDRPEGDTLQKRTADERDDNGDREGGPVGQAPLQQLPGDEGREHRHLALREIQMMDRLEDHDDGQRHQGIDAAGGKARQNLAEKEIHRQYPR